MAKPGISNASKPAKPKPVPTTDPLVSVPADGGLPDDAMLSDAEIVAEAIDALRTAVVKELQAIRKCMSPAPSPVAITVAAPRAAPAPESVPAPAPAPEPRPAPRAAPEPVPAPAPATPEELLATAKGLIIEVAGVVGRDKIVEGLRSFGAARLTEVPPAKLPEFIGWLRVLAKG